MWDQRISYCIGQKLDGGSIWFISNDRAFRRPLGPLGNGHRVRSLPDYDAG